MSTSIRAPTDSGQVSSGGCNAPTKTEWLSATMLRAFTVSRRRSFRKPQFPKTVPGAEQITLEQNYRSRQPILATTNHTITLASKRYTKDLLSTRDGEQEAVSDHLRTGGRADRLRRTEHSGVLRAGHPTPPATGTIPCWLLVGSFGSRYCTPWRQ